MWTETTSSAQWLCWLCSPLCWLCSMALLTLLTTLLALLNGSAGSAHGSAGSAQWLCSRLCSLITTFCHIAYIKLRHLWRVTAHDNSLFLILTNRSLILSGANSSNNLLAINQTPTLRTYSIRSKFNNNISSTFWTNFGPQKVACQPAQRMLLLRNWANGKKSR